MSLAPGRPSQPVFQRSSSGSNLADMALSTANRTSSINMYGGASQGARKSFVPQTPAGQTSAALHMQQSTQRRSSIYSGRQSSGMGPAAHQSFFTQAPAPAGVPKDPRPLKDRSFQAQIGQELLDYLTHNNFEMDMKHSLTQNTLRSPTQKDFNFMFQWLYNRIDPSYRFHGKIDQEVPAILKQLRYPFEKSITKSQIAAVGGNNWGTFLGMLHWIMQLAKMGEQYNHGMYDEACLDAGHDVSADRVIFEFLKDAYHAWLAMDDDADDDKADEMLKPYVERMASQFDQANSKYLDQVKMLEAEHESLQSQIDELGKAGPRIAKLDEQTKILEEDRGKFESWNSNMEVKIQKYESRAKLLEDEIAKVEVELQEAEEDKAGLQADLDSKGMNIADIDRLITQRERLQRDMEVHAERLEEMKKRVSEKEESANELLTLLENRMHEYNTLGFNVGVIPKSAGNAKGQDFELSLRLNPAPDFKSSARGSQSPQPDRLLADSQSGYLPQHLLTLDMRGGIKNAILALRKEVSARRNQVAEADMRNKELLDNIREAIEDKQQEVEKLQYQLKTAETDYNNFREVRSSRVLSLLKPANSSCSRPTRRRWPRMRRSRSWRRNWHVCARR